MLYEGSLYRVVQRVGANYAWTQGLTGQGIDIALIDSGGICVFFAVRYVFTKELMIWPEQFSRLLNFATGADYSPEEALQAAERVYNLERLFLIGADYGPEQDSLAPRLLYEPMPEGPAKGRVVYLEEMLREFYKFRDWPGGIPSEEKLSSLGLI